MNKTIIWAVVIVLAVIAAYFIFTGYKTPQSNMQMPASGEQPAQTQNPAGSNIISIQNFAFNPAALTVKVGDTVTWTNNDSVLHQIKSDTFNSNQLSKGQSYSFTFQTAGTFDYSCAIHPTMKGQIIVQ